MMNQQSSTPQSRRERPAKPALTRQGIIEAALAILRAEGLNKVTMRRIADELDTGPASLYVYVHNTADLHVQILDALLVPVIETSPAQGTWRDRLQQLLAQYMQVLFAYPEIARMTLVTHPSGPNYLALLERLLALLQEGGVPDQEAAWAVDALLLYATAHAAEHSTRAASSQAVAEDSTLVATVATVDADRYPHIARVGGQLFSGEGPERFRWGIDMFLNGVLNASQAHPEQGRA